MKNKGYGDFGYTPDLYSTDSGMGASIFDDFKALVSNPKEAAARIEQRNRDNLQSSSAVQYIQKLDPNADAKFQQILSSGGNAVKSSAQQFITDQAKSPATQTKAISASFEAAAKYTDGIITSMRAGTFLKTHPAIVYTIAGLVGLGVISWGLKKVGQGRAKALVGAAKKTAKANPQKSHKARSKRKAKGFKKSVKKKK